jgi:hypothetical protein
MSVTGREARISETWPSGLRSPTMNLILLLVFRQMDVPMFDFEEVGVAVLGASVEGMGDVDTSSDDPVIVPLRSLLALGHFDRPLKFLLRQNRILRVHHRKDIILLQFHVYSTNCQPLQMRNHMQRKRNLRPNNVCRRGNLNRVLTLIRPQVLDTLKVSHMSEIPVPAIAETQKTWGTLSERSECADN